MQGIWFSREVRPRVVRAVEVVGIEIEGVVEKIGKGVGGGGRELGGLEDGVLRGAVGFEEDGVEGVVVLLGEEVEGGEGGGGGGGIREGQEGCWCCGQSG